MGRTPIFLLCLRNALPETLALQQTMENHEGHSHRFQRVINLVDDQYELSIIRDVGSSDDEDRVDACSEVARVLDNEM